MKLFISILLTFNSAISFATGANQGLNRNLQLTSRSLASNKGNLSVDFVTKIPEGEKGVCRIQNGKEICYLVKSRKNETLAISCFED